MTPALYRCAITHARRAPVRNAFRYRSYLWLVDLGEVPRLRWPLRALAGFDARDHVGGDRRGDRDPAAIRRHLDAFLAGEGIDLRGGRVQLLTAARVLGYVFNPLSVYWCHDADGGLACVVAEVHNTYGGRHCYLLRTDADGRAEADKAFYVSPFEPVAGRYAMALPEPGGRLDLRITLHRPGSPPFHAAVHGRREPATAVRLLRAAARHPLAPLAVAVRIRRQGIGLWLRGLPVVPRPPVRDDAPQPQEAASDQHPRPRPARA